MSWRDSSGAVVVEHCAIDGICAMVNRYPSDREIASPQRRDKALARRPVRRASMKDCTLMLPMDPRIVEAEDVFEAYARRDALVAADARISAFLFRRGLESRARTVASSARSIWCCTTTRPKPKRHRPWAFTANVIAK
jgi:hypothetical protein